MLCLALAAAAFAQVSVRPSASGTFSDRNGGLHSWVVGPARTLTWDGVPFIPSGVILESRYLCESPTEELWRADSTVLDALKDGGVSDLIVRPSAPMTLCPREAWQKLIDRLEEKGFTYGIEIRDGPRARQRFVIVRPALYRESGVKPPVKRSYTIPGAVSCAYCLLDARSGGTIEHGYARVTPDGKVEIDLPNEAPGPATLVAYPTKEYRGGEAGYPDLWAGFAEYRDRLLKTVQDLKLGPGLRFFYNPLVAGVDARGEFADAIPDSSEFRTEFEAWLAQRYTNPAAARAAWGITDGTVDSFQQLARLVPLWAKGRGVSSVYDRASDALYAADAQTSKMWSEITEFRDSSLQSYLNTIAGILKKYAAGVPVVVKCSGHSRVYANAATGGFDGLAADSLGMAGAAYSLTEESARTMWLMAAGTIADSAALDSLRSLGMKAFYPFVISAGADTTQPVAVARTLAGALSLSNPAEYSPNALYFPSQPPVGGVMGQLPDGTWWLPTLRQGTAVSLGDTALSYALGADLCIWSDSGPARLTFVQRSKAKERRATLVYPSDPKAQKSIINAKKDRMIVTVSGVPIVLRGMDPLQIVPLETARAGVDRLAAYANYAEQAGVEVAGYKLAVRQARKILDAGRPWAALDMAQANLQRLCAVYNPYLWFEAETLATYNFDGPKSVRGASAGLCLAMDGSDDPPMSPYSFTVNFDVPRDGKFEVWLAGSSPGRDGASPASFSIDGSDWRDIGGVTGEQYAPGLFWQNLGTISFAGGKHSFTLKLNGRGGNTYRFLADVVFFALAPFTPKGIAKPLLPAHYVPGGK